MHYRLIIAVAFAASFAESHAALSGKEVDQCADIQTSQQIDECAASRYKSADRDLNEAYKRLMTRIDTDYKADHRLGDELRTSVKKAQQAWIKFRDANCAVEAFEIEAGTAAHVTTVNSCLARMTIERTKEIQRLLP